MIISHKKPPHYLLLKWVFGFDWGRNVATFGDTIYFRVGSIPEHLMRHEKTHLKQQKFSKVYAVWWWAKYLVSKKFRYKQELEAYQAQWNFCVLNYYIKERQEILKKIAGDLSGRLYGNLTTYDKAVRDIIRCHD